MSSSNQTPFMSIHDAAKETGLSRFYLRNACRSGECPHVMSGNKYMINVAALLRKYGADAEMEEENG